MGDMLAGGLASSRARAGASEDGLIAAARTGDVDAFGVLFEQNKNAVYSFVAKRIGSRSGRALSWPQDAEDIVQEVFCRAWQSLGRFRGDCRLLTWLCKIAANLCVDYARSARKMPCTATEADIEAGTVESMPPAGAENRSIIRQAVAEALDGLPLSHRMLVVLCDIEGFTCAEAARIVGCSHVSVRVRLSRAHKKLRTMLADILDEVG